MDIATPKLLAILFKIGIKWGNELISINLECVYYGEFGEYVEYAVNINNSIYLDKK